MDNCDVRLIICGIALLLFSIIIAIINKSLMAYLIGGVGLVWVFIGCYSKDGSKGKDK